MGRSSSRELPLGHPVEVNAAECPIEAAHRRLLYEACRHRVRALHDRTDRYGIGHSPLQRPGQAARGSGRQPGGRARSTPQPSRGLPDIRPGLSSNTSPWGRVNHQVGP
jgi:hypothetical protein